MPLPDDLAYIDQVRAHLGDPSFRIVERLDSSQAG
jgi:hypothetical protein